MMTWQGWRIICLLTTFERLGLDSRLVTLLDGALEVLAVIFFFFFWRGGLDPCSNDEAITTRVYLKKFSLFSF